ncbi:MAG: hypothetical protein ACI9S8_003246 [Chlamydiales bacterium]|jgi:hypothetical protein
MGEGSMAIKHHIRLSSDEQKKLNTLIKNPKIAKYKRNNAQILIGLDENGPALKADDVEKMCAVTTGYLRSHNQIPASLASARRGFAI